MKKQIKWTEDKIEHLKENYGKDNLSELANYFGISTGAVKDMANKRLGLRSINNNKEFKLSMLLEDTNTNWYWYGFIAGDGNVSDKYLRITLSPNDKNHLEKLSNILNCKISLNNKGYNVLCVGDKINCPILKNKLGYDNTNTKTTNPLEIKIPHDLDMFFCYIIGLIDADGCIEIRNNKAVQIKIELHSNWLGNLELLQEFLLEYLGIKSRTGVNNRGYSFLRITSNSNIVKIKEKAMALDIKYLERKWSKVK